MNKNRVLIVGASEENRKKLSEFFVEDFKVIEASDSRGANLVLAEQPELSLILIDLYQNESKGVEFLSQLHQKGLTDKLPVLVITAENSPETAKQVYSLGAAAYLSMPFVDYFVTKVKDLKCRAERDSLTKIYNHEQALLRVGEMIKNSKSKKFALYLIDVDYFKKINDSEGHLYGDSVLRNIGEKLNIIAGDEFIAARVGGDEFVIFAEYGCDPALLAEKLLSEINGDYNGKYISVSVGVALYPENGNSYEELFLHADRALYVLKRNTKRGYTFYNTLLNGVLSHQEDKELG